MATAFLLAAMALGGGVVAHPNAQLIASDGAVNDFFGSGVALDGSIAAVGTENDDLIGSVYMFRRSGGFWNEEAKIAYPGAFVGTGFGRSISLDGSTLAVGAPHSDEFADSSGSVYVFVANGSTWIQEAMITASDPGPSDVFGGPALSGDRLAIAAPGDDGLLPADPLTRYGSVYIFERSGTHWTEVTKLMASDAARMDAFGCGIDLDGDTLLVGACRDDHGSGDNEGSAYIFVHENGAWSEQAKLVGSSTSPGSLFGAQLSLNGKTAAIVAQDQLYVFQQRGAEWIEVAVLTAPSGGPFATDVDLVSEDLLVASVPSDDTVSQDAGATYVYVRDGAEWLLASTLVPAIAGPANSYGFRVAADAGMVLVGAPTESVSAPFAGAAYIYEHGAPLTYCTAKTNSLGCVPYVVTQGLPSATCTGAFEISAQQVLPSEAGILLYGFGKANGRFHGGKTCIKAPLFRALPAKFAKNTGKAPCKGVLRRDFNAYLQSGAAPLLTAGQVVRAQWLQRDPADPAGFGDGLTDAIQFTVGP